MGRYKNSLPNDVEEALADHVRDMSRTCDGMTTSEVRKLAFVITKEKIYTNLNDQEKIAKSFLAQ